MLGVGAATGLGLAMLAFVFWPGPVYNTSAVMTVRFESQAARDVQRFATTSPAAPTPHPARIPAFEDLSRPAQRRVAWAHEKAAWSGTGWILCDLSAVPTLVEGGDEASLARLLLDERGYMGDLDPATSHMAVVEGWLPLTVNEPAGQVEMQVGGGIFSERARSRIAVRWSDAEGEVPGACAVEVLERDPDATRVTVEVVTADGGTFVGTPPDIVGCGTTTELGSFDLPSDAPPCHVHAEVRGKLLYSQVTVGPPTRVDPQGARELTVQVVVPEPPGATTLPRFDETLTLLDLAAFSGSEVLADQLDLVLDDLDQGEVDLTPLASWSKASDLDDPSVTGAIGAAWQAWGELDGEE